VLASVFQSVTARTAGFNTVPIGAVSKAGLLLLIGLMFIGASPGSTGGGIKTTTAAVLWAASWAALRGRSQVQLFRRTVPRIVVRRALALAVLSALLLTGMALVLMSVERPDQPFEHLVFEIVSAFGTVGLSAGATPKLTDLGRLIITALMFTGRVGPLTLALVFLRERPSADYTYAEERLMVG
jgi:trk system potassium uptake protein TrkH